MIEVGLLEYGYRALSGWKKTKNQ